MFYRRGLDNGEVSVMTSACYHVCVEVVMFYCTLRCWRPMLKPTLFLCLYSCGVGPMYFVGGIVNLQWYWMVEEGMFGVVVGVKVFD